MLPKKDSDGTKHLFAFVSILVHSTMFYLTFPIPLIKELFARILGFKVVSALDFEEAYLQFTLAPDSRIKATFTWNGIKYFFVGCPFGVMCVR